MNTITPAQLQQMLSENNPEAYLPLIQIDHPELSEPIRLVYNTVDIVSNGSTWHACDFDLALPDDSDDIITALQFTVNDASLTVAQALRTLVGKPKVTYLVVLGSDPDTVLTGPFVFDQTNVTINSTQAVASLGYEDDIWSQQVPWNTYTPVNSAGLFV